MALQYALITFLVTKPDQPKETWTVPVETIDFPPYDINKIMKSRCPEYEFTEIARNDSSFEEIQKYTGPDGFTPITDEEIDIIKKHLKQKE